MSAVLSGRGSPARNLDHALSEDPYDFDLLAPSQLFPKLEEVLARPKIQKRLGWSEAEISIYTRRLKLFIREIEVGDTGKIPKYTKDSEDDPYVHTAVLTRASYLISGDSDILDMQNPPVRVLDASQFISLWEAGLL